MNARRTLVPLLAGTVFGWLLSRGGLTDYDVMVGLFRLDNLHVGGVMGVAIALNAIGFWALRRAQVHPPLGDRLELERKGWPKGLIAAGLVFGAGWALTGACPGPALTQLGEGKLGAAATIAGIFFGTWLFGWQRSRPSVPASRPQTT